MSVLQLPRVHFHGTAVVNRPTQCRNRNGEVDFPTARVFVDGAPLGDDQPPTRYHEHLARTGRRYGRDGRPDPDGPFSENAGYNAGGNQHFIWRDTRVVGVQTGRGRVEREGDPLLGSLVEVWGHFNEYLRTTANRARFVDLDPSSRWTPQVMVGHFTFGRTAPSVESPNVFSAYVDGSHGARWLRSDALIGHEGHVEHADLTTAMTFHFVVPRHGRLASGEQHFAWGPHATHSPIARALQQALEEPDAVGLAVQYTLLGMAPPEAPESPALHELFGTIGVARAHEAPTRPPGRQLEPVVRGRGTQARMGPASVAIEAAWATFNLPATVPWVTEPGGSARPVEREAWELRLARSGTLLAVLDARGDGPERLRQGGMVDVPVEPAWTDALAAAVAAEGLEVRGARSGELLLREREEVVDADAVNLVLDHPDRRRGLDFASTVTVRSFVRGAPASVGPVRLRNVVNPAFWARSLRGALERDAVDGEVVIAEPCTADGAAASMEFHTDAKGLATLTLRGRRPGSARLFFETPADALDAASPARLGTLAERYDEADATGFWSVAGALNVRVLADDWHLLDVSPSRVDYGYLYRNGLMLYELLYPFMALSVFSLADQPKFETYARLMYQMCDPANRAKTYYMPSTRDMTPAQTQLMFLYMGNVAENHAAVFDAPAPRVVAADPAGAPSPREEVQALLRSAAELEMALMLQYLYAAYSLPNHRTASELVRRGRWTPEQLALVAGDGRERPRHGWRGVLLEIAHEEMIHFHVVTNLLMATGAPFYLPAVDWPRAASRFALGAEAALEPFSLTSVSRFVHFERPATAHALASARQPARLGAGGQPIGSVGELYARIRHLVDAHPGLVQGRYEPFGREHHLFLTERVNQQHPDFQAQVWSRETALYALDVLVSQGEGRVDAALDAPDAHFHRLRRVVGELTTELGRSAGDASWDPAYPALRNPTLAEGEPGFQTLLDPAARAVAEINEECFALMLVMMARHHVDIPAMSLRRSRLMNASIDVMTGMVRPLSIQLMAMPSGVPGYTAGPTFRPRGSLEPYAELDARAGLFELSRRFAALHARAAAVPAIPRAPLGMMHFYAGYFDELARRPTLSMTTE